MIAQAASKLPWKQIVLIAANLLKLASAIYNEWVSKPKPPPVDPHAETKTQIAAIAQRLEVLEATETDQIKLMKEMAEQLQSLSIGLGQVSNRGAIVLWLAGSALVISCIALAVALFR